MPATLLSAVTQRCPSVVFLEGNGWLNAGSCATCTASESLISLKQCIFLTSTREKHLNPVSHHDFKPILHSAKPLVKMIIYFPGILGNTLFQWKIYVVTDANGKFRVARVLIMPVKNYNRPSDVSSSKVALFVLKARPPFYYRKLEVELSQGVHKIIEMILKALGPLSCLYLAKNKDRKGCNTPHTIFFSLIVLHKSICLCHCLPLISYRGIQSLLFQFLALVSL